MQRNDLLSAEKLQRIEAEIKESSIPYDYDTKEYPIEVIVNKFAPQNGEATLFIPTYQRDLVWSLHKQSKFIESLFLGVPIPPIFVAIKDDTGTLEIIDGSQRIRTISRYISNQFCLSGLEEIANLNNTYFAQLLPARQRKFTTLSIRFHVVSEKADLAIRADIFDRLNSNVQNLTPTEIRRGAYATNQFYQFIAEMAQSDLFVRLVPVTKVNEREELALRFYAYSEDYENFRHDVTIFLNRYVERKGQEEFNRAEYINKLNITLNFVEQNFPNGFGKIKNASSIPRVRFEALAVGTYLALTEDPNLAVDNVRWIDSKEFKKHTTSDASNNRAKLIGRIEFVRDCLLGRGLVEGLKYE